jgi:hypothetical protein
MDFDLSAVVAVLSALAAVISAWLAHQANRDGAKKERENRVREVSLLANKVVAATVRVDDLANDLKMAYQSLFTFAGQGPKSSRAQIYTGDIEKKQQAIGPMQKSARDALDSGVVKLKDDDLAKRLLEFDGYLAQLDRVREKFHVDLARVESQNQVHREKALDVIGPAA